MKLFLFALIACVAADGDGFLGYNGLYGYNNFGYRTVGAYPSYTGLGYSSYSPYSLYGSSVYSPYRRIIGKREAEAEPEGDGDGYLAGYTGLFNRGFYGSGLYSTYARPLTGYTGYTGYTPYSSYVPSVYGGSIYNTHRVIGKRDADGDGDGYYPYNAYNNVYNTGLYGYRSYATPLTYTSAYTNYANYYPSVYGRNIYNNVRYLGKRDADGDGDGFYAGYPGYTGLYNRAFYGSNMYNTYARPLSYTGLTGYSSYVPSVYGRSLYNTRHFIGKREAEPEADGAVVYKDHVTGFHTNAANLNKGINNQFTSGVGSLYQTHTYNPYFGYNAFRPYMGYMGYRGLGYY